MREELASPLSSGVMRFAYACGLCLVLGGCGSINIPLGSLLGTSSAAKIAEVKNDDITTGSIAPADTVGKDAAKDAPPSPAIAATEAKTETKTADTEKAEGKPFTLDAPAETTGSLPAEANAEPKSFGKDDHEAILAILGEALPEKGSANSLPWKNEATGYGGMVVPLAQLTKTSDPCRDLLISYGKGTHKDWYKGESCRSGNKWRLNDVTPWRKTR